MASELTPIPSTDKETMDRVRSFMGGPTKDFIRTVLDANLPKTTYPARAREHVTARWVKGEMPGDIWDLEREVEALIEAFSLPEPLSDEIIAAAIRKLAESIGVSAVGVESLRDKGILGNQAAKRALETLSFYELKKEWFTTQGVTRPVKEFIEAVDKIHTIPGEYPVNALLELLTLRIDAGTYTSTEELSQDTDLGFASTTDNLLWGRKKGALEARLQRKLTGDQARKATHAKQ